MAFDCHEFLQIVKVFCTFVVYSQMSNYIPGMFLFTNVKLFVGMSNYFVGMSNYFAQFDKIFCIGDKIHDSVTKMMLHVNLFRISVQLKCKTLYYNF